MAAIPIAKAELLIGKVLQISKIGLNEIPCVKVRCRQNDYSEHIKAYFTKSHDILALDSDSKTKIGDTILIRRSDSKTLKTSSDVQHIVERVVFNYGKIVDPVTKKEVFDENWYENTKLKQQLIEEVFEKPKKEHSTYQKQIEAQHKIIETLKSASKMSKNI